MRIPSTLFLLLTVWVQLHAQSTGKNRHNDYTAAWKALDKNDFNRAKTLLVKAAAEARYRDDALSTLIVLDSYLGIENKDIVRYNNPLLRTSHPQDYIFALWFNGASMGSYGKMDSAQQVNADYMLSHQEQFNGSMQAAAHYFKSLDEMIRHHVEKSHEQSAKIGAVRHWAFTGPFDNTAGSGFNKNYAPVSHPQADTTFKSYNNTPVKWFIPAHIENNSWIFCKSSFPVTSGLIYAQSFIQADEDRTCLLCLGGAGSLKVWVNDRLLFSQSDEKVTELDAYKVPCHLKKGYNRILVQLGYADTDLPNFILRFTDKDYHPISGLVATAAYHPYGKDNALRMPAEIPLFAETFFKEKIRKAPENPINYILLAKTYLRNQKYYQAQKTMSALLQDHPDNVLVLLQYMLSLESASDNTDALEYLEKIKTLDPTGVISLLSRKSDLQKDKKYKEAIAILDQIAQRTGLTDQVVLEKIKVLGAKGDIPGMVSLIKAGHQRYPDNANYALMLYNYYKKVSNDPVEALKVLKDYNDRLSNYGITAQLAQEYIDEGQFDKGMGVMRSLLKPLPGSENVYNGIATAFYNRNLLDSAIVYLKMLSANGPYRSGPYSDLGTCYLQKGDTANAVDYFQQALYHDPSLSLVRQKMRTLKGAPDLYGYLPAVNEDSLIGVNLKHPYDTTHHYFYIFDIHNTVVYAQGSNDQEARTAVYVCDDKGIDKFNTVYIPYNENYQQLTILKAEVVKSNGSRIPAEVNNNEIVYPKLARGDVIYYHYKLGSNGVGRLGREFWDKFYFSAGVPTCLAEYNILIAAKVPLYYKCTHDPSVKPEISTHENFRLYSWKMRAIPALKEEPLMPPSVDVGKVLHVSTIPSWDVIADWYSDLTREQSEKSLNLEQLTAKLFPKGASGLNDMEKARRIYQYIVSNIAYNAVPFMHSAYVPQKASKTLSTRLGDCKDVATLFVALAREVGLNANLVLVNTRDNGQDAMTLPSLEFNHCIVKFTTGGQNYYLELTDKNLPFRALPGQLYGAEVLNIPYGNDGSGAKLTLLKPVNKLHDAIHRKMMLTLSGNDLEGNVVVNATGTRSSGYRDRFRNESENDIDKTLTQMLTQSFKKPVEIDTVNWTGLNHLSDSVEGQVKFVVKNEIIQLGDMDIWKPNFIDVIASPNLFTVKKRKYPIEYWQYENTQHYETELEMKLPTDKTFKNIPENIDLSFNDMHYHLSYRKISPQTLLIQRSFITQPWNNISVADYAGLESFFHQIIKAESRYISF
ncbi:MAG TPA: DUF3857 domain-containing protein [Chitinophagaceae bacterium]|nr:DUF3857 domain-containing protein [Chitinophagaceae bacterium]